MYGLARPFLFGMDAERAHGLGLLPDASVDALVDQYVTEHRAAITLPLN